MYQYIDTKRNCEIKGIGTIREKLLDNVRDEIESLVKVSGEIKEPIFFMTVIYAGQ